MFQSTIQLYSRLFACGLALFWLLMLSMPVLAAKGQARPLQQVIVAPVEIDQIHDLVEALGTARANESVNLTSNVTEKVQRINFADRQQVKAGDVLVELEQEEERANLKQAEALLGERQLTLQRVKRLAKQKLAAADQLDRARLEVDQARANIRAIQARISDRVVRAPFDGIVGLRQISVGALVETGDLITTLDDISVIKLDFTVPAVYLPEVKIGLGIRAQATALGDRVYEGEVTSFSSRVDPVTRTIQVRAILPNEEGRIVPGILMKIDLLRNPRESLLIPEAALLPLGEKQFVMVLVEKDGKQIAEKRELKIGTRLRGRVEVLDGLKNTDKVITHGGSKVKPGGSVKVLAVDDGTVDIKSIIRGKPIKGKQP
jgi:membrane fusion protein (multidrug efflux system)